MLISKSNYFFVFLLLFVGCSNLSTQSQKMDNKINDKCEKDISEIKVFQVLEDGGGLALTCNDTSDLCRGMVVALYPSDEMLWDQKKIKPLKDQCFVVMGTYKYSNNSDLTKTVPVLGFDYKYPPVDMDEVLTRMESQLARLKNRCMKEPIELLDTNKKTELCNCYMDTFRGIFRNALESSTEVSNEVHLEKWAQESEEKCGVSPRNLSWFK